MMNQPAVPVTREKTYNERLKDQMVTFFSLDEVKTLAFDLGIDYDELDEGGKTAKIRSLITFADKRKLLSSLVSLAREVYPHETWDMNSTIGLEFKQGVDGTTAERGLEALHELMTNPAARGTVVAFRTDFEATNKQIDVLSNYKEVHDMLHMLEVQAFNLIQQAARNFPDDEFAIENLYDAEITLADVINRLNALADRPTFGATEMSWVQNLDKGRDFLNNALDNEDPKQLRRAILSINRVIAIQPNQINTRLNAVARGLRLREIREALTQIYTQLSELNLDKQKLDQFANGALSLSRLHEQLEGLVEGHDNWQMIMVELRLVETEIEQDPTVLEFSWPDIKMLLQPLYESKTEDWQSELKRDVDRLDKAVADENPARMKQMFRRLDRRAGDRFVKVISICAACVKICALLGNHWPRF